MGGGEGDRGILGRVESGALENRVWPREDENLHSGNGLRPWVRTRKVSGLSTQFIWIKGIFDGSESVRQYRWDSWWRRVFGRLYKGNEEWIGVWSLIRTWRGPYCQCHKFETYRTSRCLVLDRPTYITDLPVGRQDIERVDQKEYRNSFSSVCRRTDFLLMRHQDIVDTHGDSTVISGTRF